MFEKCIKVKQDGRLYFNPNILDEDNEMEIVVVNEKTKVICNNCGSAVDYMTETRMCSGFVGCDSKLEDGRSCYFDDLLPRVLKYKEAPIGSIERKKYREGKVYRFRDGE